MSQLDRALKILHARIVYWGPEGSGKTATLNQLRRHLDPEGRTRFYSVNDAFGRTFSFDLLPLEEFPLGSYRVRTRLMATGGGPDAKAARRVLLEGADAVVFVADSQRDEFDRNVESLRELEEALAEQGIDKDSFPIVFSFNKQDHPELTPTDQARWRLSAKDRPAFETTVPTGAGLLDAFSDAFRRMVESLIATHEIAGTAPESAQPSRLLPTLARGVKPRSALRDEEAGRVVVRASPAEKEGADPQADPAPVDPAVAGVQAQLRLAEICCEGDARNHLLQERNRELMALNRVARSILGAMEAENLLLVMLDCTAEHLGSSHASCVVFDVTEKDNLWTHVLGFGRDPVLGLPQECASGFFKLLAEADGPVPFDEERNREIWEAIRQVDVRVQRAIFMSIKTAGKLAGWIGIYGCGDEPPMNAQGLIFLSSIGRLASMGLDKIALLDRVKRFTQRLEEEVRDRTGRLEMANAKIRALNRGLEARVTERTRELESLARKLKEARAEAVSSARLRGMGQLAAAFAGEIRQPVEALRSSLVAMQEALDELRMRVASAGPVASEALKDVDAFEERLAAGNRCAQKMTGVIESLRRFGGQGAPRTLSLNAAVADAVTLLEERIRACAEIELRLGTVAEVPGEVRELSHVVLALLTNAVEAIERTGQRGRIEITTFSSGGKATLVLRDSGCGIEAAILPHIFEPFVTTKKDEASAGLGLHVSFQTVQRHGGQIRVKSKPGEGTTVTVVLPAEESAPIADTHVLEQA